MFKKSKFLLVAFAGLLVAGCGEAASSSVTGPKTKKFTITVWSSQEDLELQEELCNEFAAAHSYDEASNTNYEFKFYYGAMFDTTATQITQDITTAADVFTLPDDQLILLKQAGALAPFRGTFATDIRENFVGAAVTAATIDGELYAYPYTNDNGYFLYYNSNFLSEEEVKTMDGMMTKLATINKKLVFDLKNAWYLPAFFATSGTLTYDSVTKQQVCDFDNEEGKNNARGLEKLVLDHLYGESASGMLLSSSVDNETAGFETKDEAGNPVDPTIVAGVSGTWNANKLKAAMGDGYAAAKLPTFTPIKEGGQAMEQRQLGSFAGAKLMGVKIQQDPEKLYMAQLLAKYLNSPDAQVRRYLALNLGPANKEALENEQVGADIALQALNAQAPFALVQSRAVGGKFWTPMAAFGTAVVEQDYGDGGNLITALQEAVAAITAQEQ
ncbi:MAG: extracellular solute-binding protein [Bacilli bacterium]